MSSPPHVEWQQRWSLDAVATTAEKVKRKIVRGAVPEGAEESAPNLFVLTLPAEDAESIKATVPTRANTVLKMASLHIVTPDSIDSVVFRVDCVYNGAIVDSICSSHCPYELFRRSRQDLAAVGDVGSGFDVALPYYFGQQSNMHFPIDLDSPNLYQFIVYCKDDFAIGSNDFYVQATICTRYDLPFLTV